MKLNILITGAGGFLGSRLAYDLDKTDKYNIYKLYRSKKNIVSKELETQNLNSLCCDLTNLADLKSLLHEKNINVIYHLAANNNNISSDDFYQVYESNIRATYSLLEACQGSTSVKLIIYCSSEEVYNLNLTDRHIDTVNVYMISKLASDMMVRKYSQDSKINFATVLFSNLYGGGDTNFNRLIPSIFRAIVKNYPIEMRSSGQTTRDYLHVQDATMALKKILEKSENDFHKRVTHQTYHLSSQERYSALEIIEKINSITFHTKINSIVANKANAERERAGTSFDFRNQSDILEWRSEIDINQGLLETYSWYKSYFRAT
jgi:CDP-glucose 4,6-dehydratase